MVDPYASVAHNYDIMIDWPARLARERPFFAQLLTERPACRMLDVGCGTGQHSRMFAGMGLNVVGLDPSEAMLAQARECSADNNPEFILGGFADIPSLGQTFDLIVVLGNTLAYVESATDLLLTLRHMRKALRPGGRLCVQVVNYDNIPAEESRWLPLINRQVVGREYLFLREYRRVGRKVEFTIITLVKDGGWQRLVERSTHFPITAEVLGSALRRASFSDIQFFGDFQRSPYDPATSPSLIAVADIG